METYLIQGSDRKDCELKIMEKYRKPFQILRDRSVQIGGFLGLGSKPGVEVEFYFSPRVLKNQAFQYQNSAPVSIPVYDSYSGNAEYQYKNQMQVMQKELLEQEKRKVIAAAGKNYEQTVTGSANTFNAREAEAKAEAGTSQKILDSLNELKEQINSGSNFNNKEHPAFIRTTELLRLNDFSEKYINDMIEKLRCRMPFNTLDDLDTVEEHLLEWIGESINIYKEEEKPRKPKIMVLIGPTGVGKTTTIVKLAAIFGIGTDELPAIDVRMITIDAYRIGAKEQIESIGNIMQIPVSLVSDKTSLRREIAVYSDDVDMFLIDTIGKSPKDSSRLGEMKEILDGCGKGAEFHLVLTAGTKASDIEDILRQFEPFNYKSVIITKMDETDRIGNVISALAEKRKPISFITTGQTVPVDIRKASIVRFLINLDGFKIDRDKIENRFPSGEAEQFRWK